MIGVITNDSFLKVADIERAFPEFVNDGEKWKIYPNLDAMLEDKDEIEIILNAGAIDGEKIKEFKNLKWFASYSAGVDMYPLGSFKEMGLILTNSSGVHGKNISEHVLGVMIMFSRNLIGSFRNQQKKVFDNTIPVSELTGKKLLIVGMGAIGKAIAQKAKAFDMEVIGIRNRVDKELPEYFDQAYSTKDLDKHLAGKDYIVSILPATKDTVELFDKSKFDLMDEKTIFMNVGRGNLIVEEDLIEALESKKIKGAFLDVFPVEPVPAESKLWEIENLFMTSHISGTTDMYFSRAIEIFKKNYKLYKNGEKMINVIDYNLTY
ncbi:MAG: D-2-hydroxyacid dehydrogenase [Tissierellia bacterium]|nr:D-2-hydroxyacid dehydrogenase [Tissierellia bacterium]